MCSLSKLCMQCFKWSPFFLFLDITTTKKNGPEPQKNWSKLVFEGLVHTTAKDLNRTGPNRKKTD